MNKNTVSIRPAQFEDTAGLSGLLHELGYDTTSETLRSQLPPYLESGDATLLVAEDCDGLLIGLISGHLIPLLHQPGNIGRITALVVGARARSSGIGGNLVRALEDWFAENRCLRYEVTSGDHRSGAHDFYRSQGYVLDERRFIKTATPH